MINADMNLHDYYIIGEPNAYGQAQLPSADASPDGQIKIGIYPMTQAIQDNIRYKDATYIGLTRAEVDDTYIIVHGKERLKVQYVNGKGRLKTVFLKNL